MNDDSKKFYKSKIAITDDTFYIQHDNIKQDNIVENLQLLWMKILNERVWEKYARQRHANTADYVRSLRRIRVSMNRGRSLRVSLVN